MNNINGTRQIQKTQVTTGPIGELMQKMDEPILEDGEDMPVEWAGSSWLTQVTKLGKSAFIIGERGAGKKTAAGIAEFDCDFRLIACSDMAELISELWDLIDRPLQNLRFFHQKEPVFTREDKKAGKPRPIRAKKNGLQAWICPACEKNCRVLLSDYSPHGEGDEEGIAESVGKVEGSCPLKLSMLVGSAAKLRGRKIILSVPEVSKEAVNIYDMLVQNAVVLFLVEPGQLQQLEKLSNRFRVLPRHQFPKPDFQVFKLVAAFYGVDKFADERSVAAAAFLSNRNLGEFLNLFRQSAASLLGLPDPKITTPLLIQTAQPSAVEPRSMAAVALLSNPAVKTAADLDATVIKMFGVSLPPREAKILFATYLPLLHELPALSAPSVLSY